MGKPKILIVGGVAGGASAAAKARRCSEDAEIIMFEKGPEIGYANCGLPYYLSGVIDDRENLLIVTAQSPCTWRPSPTEYRADFWEAR